jgi:single-strand binding protein
MARGFSKAIITGNVVRDPELRATSGGTQVCSFSVAVNYNYVQNGEKKEQVSYINCSAWGKAGEIIAQYAKKGTGILVSGRLSQRAFEDKTGVKRSATEIVVEDFNFLGGAGEGSSSRSYTPSSNNESADIIPDDIPDEPIDLSEVPF